MSDSIQDQMDGDPGDDGTATVNIPRANIRKLEKSASEGQKAIAELAQLKREMTFREAGIDPSNAAHKYFIKGYDGESTLEAIKAAAAEAGFLNSQPQQQPQAEQAIPPAELGAMSRVFDATSGPQSPNTDQTAAFLAALGAAKTENEAMLVVQKFGLPTPGME